MINKFRRSSFLRLLPVALVAFIPTGLLDRTALSGLLSWQQSESVPPDLVVVEISEDQDPRPLFERLQARICINLSSVSLSNCKTLRWNELSSESDIAKALFGQPNQRIFRDFESSRVPRWTSAELQALTELPKSDAVLVVTAQSPTALFVSTSSGPQPLGDFLISALHNMQTKQVLRWAPTQWVLSLALVSAFFSLLILYSYPAALGMGLVALLSASIVLGSLYLLDRTQLYLPFVPTLLTQIVLVFVVFLEQLDRRERNEWHLNRERESLMSLDEMRNNFLSLVTHDLKTPLARIHAQMESLLSGAHGPVADPQLRALNKILSANGQLQRSITSLLLLSRIEARQFELRKEPTDLQQLLASVVSQQGSVAQDRNVQIQVDAEPLFLVELDPAVIRELLNNLIDNAIKYAPSQSTIVIRCGESDNCPELSPPAPGVWIEVQDQGPGVAAEDREKIFGRFVKGSNQKMASDQSIQGSGLGLYLCSFFAKQHNGHMELHSRVPGEPSAELSHPALQAHESGTLVRVVLPL